MTQREAGFRNESSGIEPGRQGEGIKLIEVRSLSLQLKERDRPIFEDRSLTLEAEEKVTLTGPSGSGKTLFLRSICLLERPTKGEIKWRGKAITPSDVPLFRSQVLYVGQGSAFGSSTVEGAFQEVFKFKINAKKKWDRNQILTILDEFGKPKSFLSQPIGQLSGGEKQLINLLRAVSLGPQVLCLDEPTSALDAASSLRIEAWLKGNFKGAWIWVTHQVDQIPRVGTRSIIWK